MNCPICDKQMKSVRKDISNDPKTKKEYDRTMLVCKADDAWVTLEVPKGAGSAKSKAVKAIKKAAK